MAVQRLSDWLESHGETASPAEIRVVEERAEKAEARVQELEEAALMAVTWLASEGLGTCKETS